MNYNENIKFMVSIHIVQLTQFSDLLPNVQKIVEKMPQVSVEEVKTLKRPPLRIALFIGPKKQFYEVMNLDLACMGGL